MKTPIPELVHWTPRILGLLFAAFISLFALDVFDHHQGFWETTVALLMHLIPTAILLGTLGVAWRWPWVGGVIFPALGAFYIVSAWGRFPWSTYAIIAGPLFLMGGLFLVDWLRTSVATELK